MRKSLSIMVVALLTAFLSAHAGKASAGKTLEFQPGIAVAPASGLLTLDSDIEAGMYLIPLKKRSASQSAHTVVMAPSSPVTSEKNMVINGKWNVGPGAFDFEEKLEKQEDGSVNCRWHVSSQGGIEASFFWLTITLPVKYEGKKIMLGEQEQELPALKEKTQTVTGFHVQSIVIPCKAGKLVITGKLDGMIVAGGVTPERRLRYGKYIIRINCSPVKGLIKDGNVAVNIKIGKVDSEPIDISRAANTSFTDDVDGDRKGGWTDQGSGKDLRSIETGSLRLGDINFNILDAAKNNGKSCIVLKGAARDYLPGSATVPMNGKKYRRLYLLHATAWEGHDKDVIGTIKVTYRDASTDDFTVINKIDSNGWNRNVPLKNAVPVWSGGTGGSGQVYLYRSSFPLKDKELQSITFSSGHRPVWMIAAVSGSKDGLEPAIEKTKTVTYRADKDWCMADWPQQTPKIVKGSALDFSVPADAPAGKYGQVVCDGENFVFANKKDRRVRFIGCVMGQQLPYLEKKQAEVFADYLAATGYNVVRFHCCWRHEMLKGDGTPTLNPNGLDKFCYLLHCLRQRGIYYYFPLEANNNFALMNICDPKFPEITRKDTSHVLLKSMVPISQVAMQWIKDFSRNLLCHVNPYTGMAIKDDPALIGVELLNEDNLFMLPSDAKGMSIYKRVCTEYLRQKNGKQPDEAEIKKFLPEFIMLMQRKMFTELKVYLRSIGVDKPLTDISISNQIPLTLVRQQMDFVDIHAYWDLYQRFPGQKPALHFKYRLGMVNPLQGKWVSQLTSGAARLFGKPFAMGEYGSSYPSPYWAYMGQSEAVLAAIQNWSLITVCGLSPSNQNPLPAACINTYNPMNMLAERIGAVFFRNGEVEASKVKIPYVVTRKYIEQKLSLSGEPRIPADYFALGLCCQIGLVIYNQDTDLSQYACVVVPHDMEIPASLNKAKCIVADSRLYENLKVVLPGLGKDVFTSTNGQTTLNATEKTFSIVTPQAECFMLPAEKQQFSGKNVAVSGNKLISSCFVSSLDKQPLERSRRMLALYITDLKNTGSVIEYPQCGGAVVQEVGKLPFLLRQGKCTFTVKTANSGLPKIWALKYDGSRKKEIKPTKTADGFAFTAQAVTDKDTYFAYEICWN